MELVPTLQTQVGMLWFGDEPRARTIRSGEIPSGWTLLMATAEYQRLSSALKNLAKQRKGHNDKMFPAYRDWGTIPEFIANAFVKRALPYVSQPMNASSSLARLRANLIEIVKPIDMHVLKSIMLSRQRLDIEQAVAFILRLLPEHAPELIPLVPTIMIESCMWLEAPLADVQDTDKHWRDHLLQLLLIARIEETGQTWEELAAILFRIRRRRPVGASRGLRLPEWIQNYYPGDRNELAWKMGQMGQYPERIIANPLIISNKNYKRITSLIWRFLRNTPEKVLRRDITSLSRRLVYADSMRQSISATHDRVALAYTFLAIQRRLQLKIVSDLQNKFLAQGKSNRYQQNVPHIPTTLEERLAEIALKDPQVDWAVLTAVQRPAGVEAVDSTDELLELVDKVCESFERYVIIYGKGHTEALRPQPGRRGGFRGPVDDWNAGVDILAELRRRINDASYQVISQVDDTMEVDDFTVVAQSKEESTEKDLGLPKADKFLALDIMSYNKSWKDDVFALEKMPPQWWTWLQKRRSEGRCQSLPSDTIVID